MKVIYSELTTKTECSYLVQWVTNNNMYYIIHLHSRDDMYDENLVTEYDQKQIYLKQTNQFKNPNIFSQ